MAAHLSSLCECTSNISSGMLHHGGGVADCMNLACLSMESSGFWSILPYLVQLLSLRTAIHLYGQNLTSVDLDNTENC